MAAKPLKILVSGDVNGNFQQFFSRINAVNKKSGPFEMVFCVGNFFGKDSAEWNTYRKGITDIPLLTYILGPCSSEVDSFYPSDDGCELCPNLVYLGKKGVLTGSSGLKVAYLSGVESKDHEENSWSYLRSDLDDFQKSTDDMAIDILLTSEWPKGVSKFVKPPNGNVNPAGSDLIAQLVLAMKPRYHFSGLEGINYERLPYRNHHILHEKPRHATRFIALANVGNETKLKWLYAFSIAPMVSMPPGELTRQPADVTECPFVVSATKIKEAKEEEKSMQFFYDLDGSGGGNRKNKQQAQEDKNRKKRKLNQAMQTGPCWFCLGSPQVEKHLVVSVGDYVYMTIAKGALVPDHVLILPIGHCQSTVELDEAVLQEVEMYKNSLKKFYASRDKYPVFWERNFRSPHLQIQVVPIPKSKVQNVKKMFVECSTEKNIHLNELPKHTDIKQVMKRFTPYFYVELPTGEKLFHQISKDTRFPLQFGREVLVVDELLNMPGKEDWKSCTLSKEKETAIACEYKEAFKQFDFTLNE